MVSSDINWRANATTGRKPGVYQYIFAATVRMYAHPRNLGPRAIFSDRRRRCHRVARVARRFSISSAGAAAAVASCPQEKLIRGPLMAQRKTDPTATRQQKLMHIMNGWTGRRKNGCQKYIASVCTHSPRVAHVDPRPGGGGEAEKGGEEV